MTRPIRFMLFVICCLTLLSSHSVSACDTDSTSPHSSFSRSFPGSYWATGNFDKEFNNYGLIFEDAKKKSCSGGPDWDINLGQGTKDGAYKALYDKIVNTFNYGVHTDAQNQPAQPFQGWAEGAHVSLIFAAALEIGGFSDLDAALDTQLQRVRDNYRNATITANCGIGTRWRDDGTNLGNTCLEEYAMAASAYGWIAAYESKRGRSYTTYKTLAQQYINSTFSLQDSICLNDTTQPMSATGRGPCNITALTTDIKNRMTGANPEVVTYSINRGQNMIYGLGQMTVISSALIALEEAGASTSLTSDQKALAKALLLEAQRKSLTNGSWFKGSSELAGAGTCAKWGVTNNQVVEVSTTSQCSDYGASTDFYVHRPTMFAVSGNQSGYPKSFFSERVGYTTPSGTVTA